MAHLALGPHRPRAFFARTSTRIHLLSLKPPSLSFSCGAPIAPVFLGKQVFSKRSRRDSQTKLRGISPLFPQEKPKNRQTPQPRNLWQPGRRPEARTRSSVFQAARLIERVMTVSRCYRVRHAAKCSLLFARRLNGFDGRGQLLCRRLEAEIINQSRDLSSRISHHLRKVDSQMLAVFQKLGAGFP